MTEKQSRFCGCADGQARFHQVFNRNAIQVIAARSRSIERPDDVHQRRFARTALAHDSDHFPAQNSQIDTAQSVNLDVGGAIDLADLTDVDDRQGRRLGWVMKQMSLLRIAAAQSRQRGSLCAWR